MNVRTAAIVFLVVGVLAGSALRETSADERDDSRISSKGFPLAYIAVSPPRGGGVVTVENPRAPGDWVFYITDILCVGRQQEIYGFVADLHFPPEVGDPSEPVARLQFRFDNSTGLLSERRVSFRTALPLISTIDVAFDSLTEFPVLLAGYYSRVQPDIVIVGE